MTNRDKIINWHSFKVILSLCLKIDNSYIVSNTTGKYIWQICRETNNKHFLTPSKNRIAIFRSKFSTKTQCLGQKNLSANWKVFITLQTFFLNNVSHIHPHLPTSNFLLWFRSSIPLTKFLTGFFASSLSSFLIHLNSIARGSLALKEFTWLAQYFAIAPYFLLLKSNHII